MENNYPYDNPTYARQDAAEANAISSEEHEQFWLELFPWMTQVERSAYALADHPSFPGLFASKLEYSLFATNLRRQSERLAMCTFELPWGSVSGAVDLVTGTVCILDNGNYSPADELPDVVGIVFGPHPNARIDRVELRHGRVNFSSDNARGTQGRTLSELMGPMKTVSINYMANVVEYLSQTGKLPAITEPTLH